jgi:hypothetical protein
MSEELDRLLQQEGEAAKAATAPFTESIAALSNDQLTGLERLVQAEQQKRSGPDIQNMSAHEFNQLKARYL